MAIYLKKFENHTQYENYINGSGAILPNVSICTTEGDVYYNPYVEPAETRVVVYYDIQDISTTTTIFTNYDNSVKSIEIDGTLLDSVVTTYQFGRVGEHVIKYEFNNPTKVGDSAPIFYQMSTIKRVVIPNTFTSIGNNAFNYCSGLTTCTIGNGVTSIGSNAFYGCSGLTTCTIGSGVTSIGDSAFNSCRSLTSVSVNAVTPPTLGTIVFGSNADGRKIYVPSASVDAYKAASGWSTYATDILPIQ